MPLSYAILGIDGQVGAAIQAGCIKEGWEWRTDPDIVFDCGPAGRTGYAPATWSNYFGAVRRSVDLIEQCEAKGTKVLVLCSTPWVAIRASDPYADSKRLIEQIADAHNRHGECFVIADRIGCQRRVGEQPDTRFEKSVYQREGELAERVIASVLYVLERRANLAPPAVS